MFAIEELQAFGAYFIEDVGADDGGVVGGVEDGAEGLDGGPVGAIDVLEEAGELGGVEAGFFADGEVGQSAGADDLAQGSGEVFDGRFFTHSVKSLAYLDCATNKKVLTRAAGVCFYLRNTQSL